MIDPHPPLPFLKMHGLGNDFVVIDRRGGGPAIDAPMARALADRRRGIGCDQVVAVDDAADADAALRFWNADGSEAATCGNATRCVAAWLMPRDGAIALRTPHGRLACDRRDGVVAVNMGPPVAQWRGIPLSEAADTDALPLPGEPVATSMGNPHCTFFIPDTEAADLSDFAPYETHPLFPQRTNVQIATILAQDHIRVRVWERGAGETPASGSSACAVLAAAVRRGLTGRRARIALDGGTLEVEWRADGIWMAGETALVARGEWLL